MADAPDLPEKPVRCKGCGTVLGTCTPRAFLLGKVRVWRSLPFRCVACDRWGRWSPTPRPPRVE